MEYGTFQTGNPSEFEIALRPWDVMLSSSYNRDQSFELEYFSLPGLMVYRERYSHDVRLIGMPPPGRLAITVPSSGTGDSTFYGTKILDNQLYALTGDFLESHYCAGFSQLVIEIDLEHNFQGSMALAVEKLASRNRNVSFARSAAHVASLHHVLERGLRLSGYTKKSAQPALIRTLSSKIEIGLCRAVLSDDIDPFSGATTRQDAAVGAMLEQLRATEAEIFSVSKLCKTLGVSERTLERGVRAQFDTTVVQILRNWRLHDARRRLAMLDASHSKVSDVAMALGFFDLGRFASAYRRLFGEYPSKTLSSSALNYVQQLVWK